MASAYHTHVPLVVVWPDHIGRGQRFDEPVSMLDVLPTVLDLVGVPMPEVAQGAIARTPHAGTGRRGSRGR